MTEWKIASKFLAGKVCDTCGNWAASKFCIRLEIRNSELHQTIEKMNQDGTCEKWKERIG
jgi:hypothetical protein